MAPARLETSMHLRNQGFEFAERLRAHHVPRRRVRGHDIRRLAALGDDAVDAIAIVDVLAH
jgi:hypothetical protein